MAAPGDSETSHAGCGRSNWSWLFIAFAGLTIVLLWQDHRAHVLGMVPYLLLFSCPLVHMLMHRRARHGTHREDDHHA